MKELFSIKKSSVDISGTEIGVRAMTLEERYIFREMSKKSLEEATAKIVALCCDAFTDEDVEFIKKEADASLIEKLISEILVISGLIESDQKEAAKN